jgi:lipocalin
MDFREFCVSDLVLRQINDVFTMADIRHGQLASGKSVSGQRRALVEEYYATLNWQDPGHVERFLKAVGYTLAQTYLSKDSKQRLQAILEQHGFAVVDGFRIIRQSQQRVDRSSREQFGVEIGAQLKEHLLSLERLEPSARGFAFEKFLQELFAAFHLDPRASFRLTGEQIDGSFQMDSDTYLFEAKWQAPPTPQSDLLVFRGKVESKAVWTRGLFISISGFTSDGLVAFSRGRATNLIGMSGQDLLFILDREMTLSDAIRKKARRAAETGEFFVSVFDLARL